jgi:hypothetical protein
MNDGWLPSHWVVLRGSTGSDRGGWKSQPSLCRSLDTSGFDSSLYRSQAKWPITSLWQLERETGDHFSNSCLFGFLADIWSECSHGFWNRDKNSQDTDFVQGSFPKISSGLNFYAHVQFRQWVATNGWWSLPFIAARDQTLLTKSKNHPTLVCM